MIAEPRLLFMAKPQPDVLSTMVNEVTKNGLDIRLGASLFAPENWHQSLSNPYPIEPGICERLLHAGSRISANSFMMTLNRIISQGDAVRGMHWEFRARGEPQGFRVLLSAVQAALSAEDLDKEKGHSPHVTISYWAPSRLSSQWIDPIDWTINEILLVEGGGEEPYRYRTIGRWPLVIPPYPYAQLRLL